MSYEVVTKVNVDVVTFPNMDELVSVFIKILSINQTTDGAGFSPDELYVNITVIPSLVSNALLI